MLACHALMPRCSHPPQGGGMGGEDTPFPHWAELLEACEEYSTISGWRFLLYDFMRLDDNLSAAERSAREAALPVALQYADDVKALVRAHPNARMRSPLFAEFVLCQKLVASEAIYNSMVATCRALGLLPARGGAPPGAPAAAAMAQQTESEGGVASAYHDTSQPLPEIARRLAAYAAALEAHPSAREQRRERLLRASFVSDFGTEHGLPELHDVTSEAMLKEFLERVREWGGADPSSQLVVRALVLENLDAIASPRVRRGGGGDVLGRGLSIRGSLRAVLGAAQRAVTGTGAGTCDGESWPLREAALDWFDNNRPVALVGGAVVAGAFGVLVASAAIMAASGRQGGGGGASLRR
mmetsp:Transcript_18805/g.48447  ORF Transcript_18805/g.48447 Transcript_18805/m.48447 type:complete len:355 (+) Transcript_18805:203-1267(+)